MAGLRFIFSESSSKILARIEVDTRARIARKLKEYQDKPQLLEADMKRLVGTRDPVLYRLRIGDHRIIGSIEPGCFKVVDIVHRSVL